MRSSFHFAMKKTVTKISSFLRLIWSFFLVILCAPNSQYAKNITIKKIGTAINWWNYKFFYKKFWQRVKSVTLYPWMNSCVERFNKTSWNKKIINSMSINLRIYGEVNIDQLVYLFEIYIHIWKCIFFIQFQNPLSLFLLLLCAF